MVSIVINNFNRLTTTKKLVEDLIGLGYNNIHIIDNNSTYPPLLDWYKEIVMNSSSPVKLFRIPDNSGQLALWNTGYINHFKDEPWIAYTDSDIQLGKDTPSNFIYKLTAIATLFSYNKVGLSLDISDLPNTPFGDKIKNWEGKYWTNEIRPDIFVADVDTTFAVIRPQLPFDYKALRVAGTFTAKHMPWYLDFDNINEEERYVMEHANNRFSTFKGHYLEHQNNKK